MKASVIIPCHPRNNRTLPQTRESLEAAAGKLEVEILVIEDEASRGPSWARNEGLRRASGEYIFFCDADDLVKPAFFSAPIAALERTSAQMCFFTYAGGPRLSLASYEGRAAVRDRFLPAFFGYSREDVCRWNKGGRLDARREMGQVWRCAYRRSFLESASLRFNEEMTLFEDAAFLSACVASANHVVTIPDELYDYRPRTDGNLATGWRSRRNWDYKFAALAFREELNSRHQGELWSYCEASCVFSALELLKARYRLREYLAAPSVRAALKRFPLSFRHPLVAAAVLYLRMRAS